MANPSVTYQFVNGQTSDGTQVSQNFTDLINALSDATKTITISALVTATAAISGNMTVGSITGIADGTNAAAGKLGEVLSSTITSGVSAPATTQFGDLTSLAVTAGRWILVISAQAIINTGTGMLATGLGIGTATGNNSAGLIAGSNFHVGPPPTSAYNAPIVALQYVSLAAASTTYYAKTYAEYGGGTPQFRGSFYAIRI